MLVRIAVALLDAYERKARLTPGLLAFAPIAFAVTTLGFKKFPAVAIAVGVLSAAGGTYALSTLVAHFGRKAQEHLWNIWNGPPTTRFLRTREESANPVQRDVWRQAIEAATGVRLLSPREEAADPDSADNTIRAAVDQMRLLGQDPRFPLVAAENTQYGYERNLYGFRWVGRAISLACTAALALVLVANAQAFSSGALIAGATIDFLFLLAWIFIPSADRVKTAGERYAQQLFQAVVSLNKPTASSGGAPGSSGSPAT
jgi:hypothetical protein